MNIKQIVIALIDRLAAYAAREAENEDPEETKRQEEAAAKRLAEKVKVQKARLRQNGGVNASVTSVVDSSLTAASTEWDSVPASPVAESEKGEVSTATLISDRVEEYESEKVDKGKEKAQEEPQARKFRGVPENVKLFEVFWQQVVELIKVGSLLDCVLCLVLIRRVRHDQTCQYKTLPL